MGNLQSLHQCKYEYNWLQGFDHRVVISVSLRVKTPIVSMNIVTYWSRFDPVWQRFPHQPMIIRTNQSILGEHYSVYIGTAYHFKSQPDTSTCTVTISYLPDSTPNANGVPAVMHKTIG